MPERVQVKLSSEAAEFVALTPVVSKEMALEELLEQVLGATGEDAARVAEVLKRGSLVSGATRFRWQGFEAGAEELAGVLKKMPRAEPGRACELAKCVRMRLAGARTRIEITREVGGKKKLFARRSYWEELEELARGARYGTYLYRERADVYRVELDEAAQLRLKAQAKLLKFGGLERQIAATPFSVLEVVVPR